jgi:transporter family-2 protein
MTQTLYIVLALAIGFGASLQTGMIASLGRSRGPTEAAWISLLATLSAVAIVFGLRALRGSPPSLPSPLDSVFIFAGIAALGGLALSVSLRGLSPYLAVTGLFGFAYLVSAGFLAPRLGIALFASAVTAGTLFGSVALDHFGAFGVDVQRASVMRILGLLALVLGVVLVRTGR